MSHRLGRFAGPVCVSLLALTVAAAPARAENWFERLLSGGTPQSGGPPQAPEAAPAPATPAPGSAALPTAKPPKRPASAKAGTEQRPAGHAPAKSARMAGDPLTTSATTPAPAAALTDRQVLDKANAYFNGISTLFGDFVQIGGDGRRLTGKLYLQRPGRLRFDYDAPATLEIIADGSSVSVRDRKLATQDLYTISQTPLKFLLSDRIDLTRDAQITGVAQEGEGVRILMEDRSTLGGTSKIALYFDRGVERLSQWRVVDPQGYLTTVQLANLERGRRMDPALFAIEYQRMDANPR